jgi:hypothetical protein
MRPISFIAYTLLAIPLSYLLGFFIAGAIVFPLHKPFYMSRVLLTLGLMGIVYGVESVMFRGHFETCGFLSGNCTQHNYEAAGWQCTAITFLLLLVVAAWFTRKKPQSDPSRCL